MLVLHHQNLPHAIRRINLVVAVIQPDLRDRRQSVLLQFRFDLFPEIGLAVDGDRLPRIKEDFEVGLLRSGADAEGDLFEENRFKVVPGPDEVIDEDGLAGEVHVDRSIGIDRSDLDGR